MASSRFAISRWLKGDAEPRLPDFFHLLEATSLRVLDFLAVFVDPAQMPSVAKAWQALETARSAAYDAPWSQAVLRCLELSDYAALPKHREGWVANRIGIAVSEEQRCLALLARTGQLRKKRRRWAIEQKRTLDTRGNIAAARKVKRWWMEVAASRMEADSEGVFSYNVFAVSNSDLTRIYELHQAYFQQIRSLIANSEPCERVVVANLQIFPLDRARTLTLP